MCSGMSINDSSYCYYNHLLVQIPPPHPRILPRIRISIQGPKLKAGSQSTSVHFNAQTSLSLQNLTTKRSKLISWLLVSQKRMWPVYIPYEK